MLTYAGAEREGADVRLRCLEALVGTEAVVDTR
jgi:hypothetical protein